jgi:3-phenylpropionate/trans-cinnamate dioxygenase ferredoxin subunit
MMKTWVEVCKVDDLPKGGVKTFTLNGVRIALCRVESGEFYAVEDVCTHDDGALGEGELVGYAIECPRHGARFDVRTGRVLCLPAVVPIKTFAVQVEGDVVKVEVPQ